MGDLDRSPCMPYEHERMIPRKDKTTEGRVNPKGIPCLYLATNKETAISEVRPWIASVGTTASFELIRDVVLVDCSWGFEGLDRLKKEDPERFWSLGAHSPDVYNWIRIDRAFSRPVTNTDDLAEYAPTQVLAEEFRRHGYDGIVYQSEVDKGKNVALFKLDDAKLMECSLYFVEAINYDVRALELNAEGCWP